MQLSNSKGKSELLEWTKVLVIAVLFVWGVRFFLLTPVVVDGASMMPTLEDGDKVVISKIEPKFLDYERFDVIVFEVTKATKYIKRIIGLPGDSITYENDELFINGKRYEEPYLEEYKKELVDSGMLTGDFTLDEYLGEGVVPEGYFFVLGDNRRNSKDSRDKDVGFISKSSIVGTAKIVLYPLDNIKKIK